MAKGTDLASIIPNIKEAIKSALQEDIAPYVKEKISEHAVSDVYNVYPNPADYIRRWTLKDTGYMNDYMSGELSLTVEPISTFGESNSRDPNYHTNNHGYGVTELVEYGHGGAGYLYDYPTNEGFLQPRPYISNTAEELNSDEQLTKKITASILKRL